MADTPNNLPDDLRRELRAAERLEAGLTRVLSRLQPPFGADQRLLAKLQPAFHESHLMLDAQAPGPINFQEAVARMKAENDQAVSDLLAAGLEEEPIDESLEDETE